MCAYCNCCSRLSYLPSGAHLPACCAQQQRSQQEKSLQSPTSQQDKTQPDQHHSPSYIDTLLSDLYATNTDGVVDDDIVSRFEEDKENHHGDNYDCNEGEEVEGEQKESKMNSTCVIENQLTNPHHLHPASHYPHYQTPRHYALVRNTITAMNEPKNQPKQQQLPTTNQAQQPLARPSQRWLKSPKRTSSNNNSQQIITTSSNSRRKNSFMDGIELTDVKSNNTVSLVDESVTNTTASETTATDCPTCGSICKCALSRSCPTRYPHYYLSNGQSSSNSSSTSRSHNRSTSSNVTSPFSGERNVAMTTTTTESRLFSSTSAHLSSSSTTTTASNSSASSANSASSTSPSTNSNHRHPYRCSMGASGVANNTNNTTTCIKMPTLGETMCNIVKDHTNITKLSHPQRRHNKNSGSMHTNTNCANVPHRLKCKFLLSLVFDLIVEIIFVVVQEF